MRHYLNVQVQHNLFSINGNFVVTEIIQASEYILVTFLQIWKTFDNILGYLPFQEG